MTSKLTPVDDQILKTTKEIVVKFIEVGRVSPNGFPELFKTVYHAIDETVKATIGSSETEGK